MSEYGKTPKGTNPETLRMREALLAWKRISERLHEEGDKVPGEEIDAAIALTDAALGNFCDLSPPNEQFSRDSAAEHSPELVRDLRNAKSALGDEAADCIAELTEALANARDYVPPFLELAQRIDTLLAKHGGQQ